MESTMARIVCCVTWPDNVYRTPSATNTAAHSGFVLPDKVPQVAHQVRLCLYDLVFPSEILIAHARIRIFPGALRPEERHAQSPGKRVQSLRLLLRTVRRAACIRSFHHGHGLQRRQLPSIDVHAEQSGRCQRCCAAQHAYSRQQGRCPAHAAPAGRPGAKRIVYRFRKMLSGQPCVDRLSDLFHLHCSSNSFFNCCRARRSR